MIIPCCPKCGEGKVILAPGAPGIEAEILAADNNPSCYCEHCTERFNYDQVFWKRI